MLSRRVPVRPAAYWFYDASAVERPCDSARRGRKKRGPRIESFHLGTLWGAAPIWHDDVALFSRCVKNSPGSAFYHEQLASRR